MPAGSILNKIFCRKIDLRDFASQFALLQKNSDELFTEEYQVRQCLVIVWKFSCNAIGENCY